MKRLAVLILSALLLAPLAAQTPPRPLVPNDFAWQWPLDVAGADGAVRLALTPDVYARLTRADLRDLAAFNASDEAIPFGPAALAFERLQAPTTPAPAPVEVPLFRVPRAEAGDGAERIELHIARGDNGRLSRLDAEIEPTGSSAPQDLLIDVSSVDLSITALRLELEELPGDGLNARVEVAASDDLANWRPLATNLALVSLRDAGLVLERRTLEFPSTELPYLRLRRSDLDAALPVRIAYAIPTRQVSAGTVSVLPPRQEFTLRGEPVGAGRPNGREDRTGSGQADAPGHFVYRSAGPFPLERVEVQLADANSVSGFVLDSRNSDTEQWLERTQGTAFRLGSDGNGVASAPLDLTLNRDTQWRLRTQPPQTRPPSLTFSYRADQFVLLTPGPSPYRLAAGSRHARRPDYPLRTVLSGLRQQHGDLWLPPDATLGIGSELAGETALAPPPPPPPSYRQWALWGVLIAGALGVVVMVLKLMKAAPASHH